MAQVKKEAVRKAILDSAYELFKKHGFSSTQVSQIAKAAEVSTSNTYVYFPSKLCIFFAIYVPWLRQRLDRLEAELDTIANPADRLRKILRAVWHEIPAADGGFANNLIQALSTSSVEEGYKRDLLIEAEALIAKLIERSVPETAFSSDELAYLSHAIFMAHDGFAMNHSLRGPSLRMDGVVEVVVSLLLSRSAAATTCPATVAASG